MAKRTLKIRSFWYHDEDGNFHTQTEPGVEFELPDAEAKRGDEMDAFVTKAEAANLEVAVDADKAETLDALGALSDEELAEFIATQHPTINELLEAVNGDGDLAKRVLDAENQATGHDPRVGLTEGVKRIVEEAGV